MIKKGIIKRRTVNEANVDGGSSPMRRVCIQVETAQHHSYSGIATVQEAPDAQNEESAAGTGSSGSEHPDVQQDSTGSEQGQKDKVTKLEEQLEDTSAKLKQLELEQDAKFAALSRDKQEEADKAQSELLKLEATNKELENQIERLENQVKEMSVPDDGGQPQNLELELKKYRIQNENLKLSIQNITRQHESQR